MGFSADTELNDEVRICRLVEGVSLALELAASWTRMLTCRQTAEELARIFDLLSTNRQNVPDRQQSLRYVFDQTWQQLNEPERKVFKTLSIFQGGFTREAAKEVTGASLPLLSNLQDKSSIRLG